MRASRRLLHRSVPLASHPFFASATVAEASEHLGIFVGSDSEWRSRGLPWRLYAPSFPRDYEISSLAALRRLEVGKPVRFQRQRIVTVTPDIKALEGLATGLAAPGLSRLAGSAKKVDSQVKADPTGIELRYGLPTTLNSLAELKLFSAIYNLEVALPDPQLHSETGSGSESSSSSSTSATEEALHLDTATKISQLMNRSLESGLEMYSVEDRVHVQFWWYFQRLAGFYLPLSLALLTPALASDAVMASLGLCEALPIAPFFGSADATLASLSAGDLSLGVSIDLESVGESLKSGVKGAAGTVAGTVTGSSSGAAEIDLNATMRSLNPLAYSSGVATVAGLGVSVARAATKAIFNRTPLGFQVTAYEAFNRVTRGEPIVLQQMTMNTFRVPFITSLSYFSVYRPGDIIENVDDLAAFHTLHRSGKKKK